jgi:predicted ribosome quality control (RQC) complex YloA/Tae2 family protein
VIRTNWQIIAQLASELGEQLRGARVQDVGAVADRLAVRLWRQKRGVVMLADLFGSPPIVWLEDEDELPIAVEPGFVRAAKATLRGMTVADVQSRAGDRILRVVFHSRSRFGVSDQVALIFELIPRFGNAILTKGDVVIAALKEFSPAENRARAVLAGHTYQPPPQRPVSESLEPGKPGPLLETIAREGRERRELGSSQGNEKRRRDLARLLERRARKLQTELETIATRRRRAAERDALREEGDAIYAGLHELTGVQREDAKQRAREAFAQYRKLGSALPHLETQDRKLRDQLEAIGQLEWDLERAEAADLDDVEQAVRIAAGRSQIARAERTRAPKRTPLSWMTTGGSRILVGRTSLENAELTFRVARPYDWWFHARGVPGAHVILQRDDRREPTDDDVLAAAALAALHSKGRTSSKVAVDYTQRKHVRKRPASAPGLVFYSEFKTVTISPGVREGAIRTPAS